MLCQGRLARDDGVLQPQQTEELLDAIHSTMDKHLNPAKSAGRKTCMPSGYYITIYVKGSPNL